MNNFDKVFAKLSYLTCKLYPEWIQVGDSHAMVCEDFIIVNNGSKNEMLYDHNFSYENYKLLTSNKLMSELKYIPCSYNALIALEKLKAEKELRILTNKSYLLYNYVIVEISTKLYGMTIGINGAWIVCESKHVTDSCFAEVLKKFNEPMPATPSYFCYLASTVTPNDLWQSMDTVLKAHTDLDAQLFVHYLEKELRGREL